MSGVVGASHVKAQAHRWEDVPAGAAVANLTVFRIVDKFDENVDFLPTFYPKEKTFVVRFGARF